MKRREEETLWEEETLQEEEETLREEEKIPWEEEESSREEETLWDHRFPQVHDIEVKHIGKNARWKSVKAVLTQQRDKSLRQRQVWISFSGCELTTEELALKWPRDKKAVTQRKLRDKEEDQYYCGSDPLEGPREFTVTEKMGVDGRQFWREVIKAGELNDEEEYREWDEMMREEGFYDEIGRLMEKE